MSYCPNCGKEVNDTERYCSRCGSVIAQKTTNLNPQNEFSNSVVTGVNNSRPIPGGNGSVNVIKPKSGKNKYIIIGIISAILVIVLLCIVTHIHKCDECDKVYLGNKHTISFFGESENLCKDCYDEYNYSSWF